MKTWTKEDIIKGLKSSDDWVIAGLMAIYDNQTRDEKASQETKYRNNIGFTAADAHKLSSFAEQVKAWKERRGRTIRYSFPLSDKQLFVARKRLQKYAQQLANRANEKEQAKAAAEQVDQPELIAEANL